jgi:hypothetical protein
MNTTQHLRTCRPLAGLSPVDRRAAYACSCMHSPNPDIRTDADAFEIRGDVDLEDACVTALRLVRAAVAQLELLGMTAELPPAFRDAVDGVVCLCRLTSGAIGLVQTALCDEAPLAGHSTC